MTAQETVIDLTAFDFDNPIIGIEDIREANPQRHEFEMLTGIVHIDPSQHLIIGFKDVCENEFWTRGHMPGVPLLPGVLMCEAAAQLCGYYYVSQKVGLPGMIIGLGAIEEARFHRVVRPGDRLVMVGTGIKVHRRLTRFRIVGSVNGEKAFEAVVSGTPLGRPEDLRGA